jgi:hypothetical protein
MELIAGYFLRTVLRIFTSNGFTGGNAETKAAVARRAASI